MMPLHGVGEWNGEWSDNSTAWTDQLAVHLGHAGDGNTADISEVGGLRPTGKSFRFVSCVRAVCMSSQIGEKKRRLTFPFSLFFSLPFPFSLSRLAPGLSKT